MNQKLSFTEKAGYSAADSAANFVFMTMILYQTNFYTDVFGLSAGVRRPSCFGPGFGTPWLIRLWVSWPIAPKRGGENFVPGFCSRRCPGASS
jgi:hypothetical protein